MRPSLRFDVLKRDGFRCRYCGAGPATTRLEVDHIVPRALGGPDALGNLATACVECNSGKRDRVTGDICPPPILRALLDVLIGRPPIQASIVLYLLIHGPRPRTDFTFGDVPTEVGLRCLIADGVVKVSPRTDEVFADVLVPANEVA